MNRHKFLCIFMGTLLCGFGFIKAQAVTFKEVAAFKPTKLGPKGEDSLKKILAANQVSFEISPDDFHSNGVMIVFIKADQVDLARTLIKDLRAKDKLSTSFPEEWVRF